MKSTTFVLLGLLYIVPIGQAADKNGAPVASQDVAAFKERRDLCDHFRGEDAYDEARGKFLAEGMKKSCTGTDKELASLKLKYRNNEAVLRAVADYEEKIERKN